MIDAEIYCGTYDEVQVEPRYAFIVIDNGLFRRNKYMFISNDVDVTDDVLKVIKNVRRISDEERTLIKLRWNINVPKNY